MLLCDSNIGHLNKLERVRNNLVDLGKERKENSLIRTLVYFEH